MVPEQQQNISQLELRTQPSLTYKLDLTSKRIGHLIDDQDAVVQAAMKTLNTERYAYVIYSSQYGVELERLIGQDYNFIVSDLERTITEALMTDDRIIAISDFTVQKTGLDTLLATFTINSIYGATTIQTEVQIV